MGQVGPNGRAEVGRWLAVRRPRKPRRLATRRSRTESPRGVNLTDYFLARFPYKEPCDLPRGQGTPLIRVAFAVTGQRGHWGWLKSGRDVPEPSVAAAVRIPTVTTHHVSAYGRVTSSDLPRACSSLFPYGSAHLVFP